MKTFNLSIMLAFAAMQLNAQEVMKVELKGGTTVPYKVEDIKRVYFETNPSSDEVTVTPSSVSLNYEGTKQLSAPNASYWTSEDEFVAKVDNTGLVTARHVGMTNVVASNGSSSAKCKIVVNPKYSLYDTPIIKWGASMFEIKNSETHTVAGTVTDDHIGYNYTFGSNTCVVGYTFKENKLTDIMVMMNFSSSLYLNTGYYLLERFQPIYQQDNEYYMIDAMDLDDAKTMVVFSIETSGSNKYICVYYAEKKTSSSIASTSFMQQMKKQTLKKEADRLSSLIHK